MSNDGEKWVRGRLLGKGSFGSVYLATLKKPKSRFPSVMAVKSAEYSVSGTLQKEKEVFNNIEGSPFVLRLFGQEITTHENSKVYNLLLEYASGGTLADLIYKSKGSGLPESDVKRYTRSILEGLNHIHRCGYVHCDLKPENILMFPTSSSTSSGAFVAKIGDLGLAKRSAAHSKKKRKLNPYWRGTALYMAPESVNENVQEPPSDIWALGCVVLEMLTGKSPWDHNPALTTKELFHLIGDDCESPKIPTSISKEGKEFLKGCFVKNPKFRHTDVMLLDHPFVAGEDDIEFEEEGLSSSLLDEDFEDTATETQTVAVESPAKQVTNGGQKRKRNPSYSKFFEAIKLLDDFYRNRTQARPIPALKTVTRAPFIPAGV